MLRLPSHLQLSHHNIFYFRRSVPDDLRRLLQRREIKKSLRTSERRKAIRLGRLLTYQVDTLYAQLRTHMNKKLSVPALELKVKGMKRNADGSYSVDELELDPNQPEAEAKLLQEFTWALNQAGQTPEPPSRAAEQDADSPTLSQLIGAFCDEKARDGSWTKKSLAEGQAIFDLLVRILGDITCSQFSHEQARTTKDILQRLPPRINTAKMYRGRSIDSILQGHPSEKMAVTSINKYLTRYSSLFDWAKRHGYVDDNYFAGVTLREKQRQDKKREAFTDSDLRALFSSRIHTALEFKHPYQYWLPLLGLFTGARLNELCQLHLTDIRTKDDVPVIDVNANAPDKRLKTHTTERLVPIHKTLIELGLLTYAKELSDRGESRLFPELPHSRDGYQKNASRWFNEKFKPEQGIREKKKVFHSFRHTLITALKRANVPLGHAKAICGHTDSSITYGLYGKDYELLPLKEALDAVDYSAFVADVKPFRP